MTTKPPSRTADQFVLRLPDGMRDRIAELAKQNGRSMNAEIVQRLEWALSLVDAPKKVEGPPAPQQPIAGALTWYITAEINGLAAQQEIPFDEMFAKIVLAGLHPTSPQVLYAPIMPGAGRDELRALLEASKDVTRPDAAFLTENLEKAPWAPEWMMERIKSAATQAKAPDPTEPQPPKRPKRIIRKKTEP